MRGRLFSRANGLGCAILAALVLAAAIAVWCTIWMGLHYSSGGLIWAPKEYQDAARPDE